MTIYYETGTKNPEITNRDYFKKLNTIKIYGKHIKTVIGNFYDMFYYQVGDKYYCVTDDTNYGIPYSIEEITKNQIDKILSEV